MTFKSGTVSGDYSTFFFHSTLVSNSAVFVPYSATPALLYYSCIPLCGNLTCAALCSSLLSILLLLLPSEKYLQSVYYALGSRLEDQYTTVNKIVTGFNHTQIVWLTVQQIRKTVNNKYNTSLVFYNASLQLTSDISLR